MRLYLIIGVVLAISGFARAEPDYRDLNRALAENVIIPAYSQLEKVTSQQKNLWISACEEPASDTRSALQAAYQATADAWAAVFHWTVGPVTANLRRERFYFWPERRNDVDKALAGLLADKNPDRLFPPTFAQTTVAVQGLPALERLLFTAIDVTEDQWACAIGRTISVNLAAIAAEVAIEWRGEVLQQLAQGIASPPYFGEPLATLNRFFTSFLTGFIILKDQKLMPGLRFKIENANPGLLEAWRSQRPLRNLQLNLQALAEVLDVLSQPLANDHKARLLGGMARSQKQADQLAPLVTGILDEAERKKIFVLIDLLTLLQTDIATTINQGLGLTIGFNSLDGD